MSEAETRTPASPESQAGRAVAAAVESLGKQLLDVGKRNKLINAPIRKDSAKQITIEDELSDEAFRILWRDRRTMTFEASQAGRWNPEEETDAVFALTDPLGGVAEPSAVHVDSMLHTRLGRERLQKQLLALYRDASALEEDQGIRIGAP